MKIDASCLGSREFKEAYGTRYAYLAGGMYRGIASRALVVRMGQAGLMAYLGTAGLPLAEVEEHIDAIRCALPPGKSFGMNLLSDLENPAHEFATVELYLRCAVRYVEAAAYIQMTPALVLYRVSGLRRDAHGATVCDNRILAKISRPEVATIFMQPPPAKMVEQLLAAGRITAEQAALAASVPMSGEICVEADSGGHTDMGIPTVIFPALRRLRDEMRKLYPSTQAIHMGLAGGIGSPESAAAAFTMGADFILTGSINQCTVEAGTSDAVKDLLQEINIQDTDYAPAGDMFELGAKVQVLKKGVFFPARANKLHALYMQYNGLEELPDAVRRQLEERYFKRSLDDILAEARAYLIRSGRIADAEQLDSSPKKRMARAFKWYFAYSTQLALQGKVEDRVDFQVHTGPALGSFNQWVKGTELSSWRARHVDDLAVRLMQGAARLLESMYLRLGDAA
jgi:trans-AT polyketide synthase/acyltransferase/oxidoreductase domain-containing protein